MERTFETNKYGQVTVRNSMIEIEGDSTLIEGIEIKGDDIGLIEILKYIDIEDLSIDDVEDLIDM